MATSQLTPERDRVDALIQEFRHYTEEWTLRFRRIDSKTGASPFPRQVVEDLLSIVNEPSSDHHTFSQQIQFFISSHLHIGVTIKDLAEFLGYSEKYCSQFFRRHMGESFSTYLKRIRIKKAKLLLVNSQMGIAEIAEALGFKDQFAFSHFFKKSLGRSPREYRTQKSEESDSRGKKKNFVSVSTN